MDKLVGLIAGASKTRSRNDDDFADRLSSRYTVVLLVVFSILVTMNQYVRNPITCWAPVHFTDAHKKYTSNYCWIRNTYYLPWEEKLPLEHEPRQMIPYYQWIPFILLAQAVLFYMPTVIWHGLNSKAGVDADNIMAAAHTFSRTDKVEATDKTLMMLTNQMNRFLSSRNAGRGCLCNLKNILSATCCRICGRRLGNYLMMLFLFSKLLYIVNAIGQLFLLNAVLSTRYSTFGVDMIRQLVASTDWTEDSYVAFPRVTFCDLKVRGQDVGNVQSYTVQCVLPINLYNEKIYVFLWFWMVAVALASIVSLFVWLSRALSVGDRVKFIRNHLVLGGRLPDGVEGGRLVRRFVDDYLRQDGAFLFRLIAHNTNNITTTEVVCALWDFWKDKMASGNDCSSVEQQATLSRGGAGIYPSSALDADTLGLRKNAEK